MKPIFLLLISTLIISCAKDSPKSKLKSILREYQPAEQIFEIESDGSIAIVGEKGTKIELNTEDLVFENGEKAEFPIEISLLELTTKEDLMKANAQTISNGRWLISGGAYKIKAFSNGKELRLKEEKNYEVTFPKIADEEMSLFFGERNIDGNMNWNLTEVNLNEKEYPLIIKEDSSFMRYDREYGIDLQVDTVVLRNPDGRFSLSKLRESLLPLDSVSVVNDTIFGYRSFLAEQVPVDSIALRTIELNNKVWEVQYQVYSAISLNKLGWINVDRFYPKINERVSLKFVVDKKVWNNQCFIIAKSDNLILNQYFDDTGHLPIDFPVGKSFEIFVFGLDGDKLYGSRKVFRTTNKSRIIELKMKEISVEEIEEYLNLN